MFFHGVHTDITVAAAGDIQACRRDLRTQYSAVIVQKRGKPGKPLSGGTHIINRHSGARGRSANRYTAHVTSTAVYM